MPRACFVHHSGGRGAFCVVFAVFLRGWHGFFRVVEFSPFSRHISVFYSQAPSCLKVSDFGVFPFLKHSLRFFDERFALGRFRGHSSFSLIGLRYGHSVRSVILYSFIDKSGRRPYLVRAAALAGARAAAV